MKLLDVPETYAYLDYAATAPLVEEAAAALAECCKPGALNIALNANANSLHTPGRNAFYQVEEARKRIADALGASRPAEIIFTSCATEADNAALMGLTAAALDARKLAGKPAQGHVIVSAFEHDAVLKPAKRLEQQGVRVSYVRPSARGFIEPAALEALMTDDTLLVSIMAANSEIGSIQPIAELCHVAHAHGAVFHTDATQALGKMPLDLRKLGVDSASFSGHKIGAPKGVGALYLKARTPFAAYLLGGGQEEGRRSGTQNVGGVLAFAAACEAACSRQAEESARLRHLRDWLYGRLLALDRVKPSVAVEPGSTEYLPNIVHVLVHGFESETLILRLDRLGFGVSGGSACSSSSLEPSHVLKAIGVDPQLAQGALRVSMGRYTTKDQIERFVVALSSVLDNTVL